MLHLRHALGPQVDLVEVEARSGEGLDLLGCGWRRRRCLCHRRRWWRFDHGVTDRVPEESAYDAARGTPPDDARRPLAVAGVAIVVDRNSTGDAADGASDQGTGDGAASPASLGDRTSAQGKGDGESEAQRLPVTHAPSLGVGRKCWLALTESEKLVNKRRAARKRSWRQCEDHPRHGSPFLESRPRPPCRPPPA